jgi:membrane-bound lytic murein transglycosylase D
MKQKMKFHIVIFLAFTLVFECAVYAQLNPLQKDTAIKKVLPVSSQKSIQHVEDPKQAFIDLYNYPKSNVTVVKGIKLEHLSPMAFSFVQDYIAKHADYLIGIKSWASPYFDMMDDVLSRNGIPKELKYLAVIESNMKASAVSWVGAVGPWQFMPETGRRWGLMVLPYHDDRQDYLKSTYAASKYLNYLYSFYHDWLLVVAAYNCGPGRVNSAISRAGNNDFWKLQNYLPAETRNHVKKFIATHYIMEGRGSVATVTKDKQFDFAERQKIPGTVSQNINGRYCSKAIAKFLEMNLDEFLKLNPRLDQILASNKTYQLILPINKMTIFEEKKNEMLNASLQMLLNPDYKN